VVVAVGMADPVALTIAIAVPVIRASNRAVVVA
jgi:hypothetical protein